MDMASAEAVGAVIRARTDTQLRAARRLQEGTLHRRTMATREELAEVLALVEADIDFAEEPIEFITPSLLQARLTGIADQLDTLLTRSVTVERLEALPRILLLGPPNAGKSTLMNALSRTPRAICAPVAGTTRDVLSAVIRLGRGEALLLDAAGVDASTDPIIVQARALTLAAAQHADVVCLVLDLSQPFDTPLDWFGSLNAESVVMAANKVDHVNAGDAAERIKRIREWRCDPIVATSATTGTGLSELRSVLQAAVGETQGTAGEEATMLTERQRTALVEAREALQRGVGVARSAKETIDCADLLAFELREALDALGAIGGAVTTEELLGRVFANFCIGK